MITTTDDARGLDLRTGKIADRRMGERVRDHLECDYGRLSQKPVSVDVAAVTYIDAEGLTLMARHGAVIVAPDSLNQELVDEIRSILESHS